MKWIVSLEELQDLPTDKMTINNLSLLHNLPPKEGSTGSSSEALLKDKAFMAMIDRLNQTSVVSRITAFTNMGKIDKNIYRTPDGIITVDQGPKGLVFEIPGNMANTTDYLMDLLGFSKVSVSALNCDLSEQEALVLSALMDIRRHALITAMHASDDQPLILDVTNKDVLDFLLGRRHRAMITSFIYGLADLDIQQFTEELVESALMKLMEKEWITKEKGSILLSKSVTSLVDALLVFNSVIRFETAYNDKKDVLLEKSTILYGAPNAILFVEKSPVGIHLMSITGSTLIRMLV